MTINITRIDSTLAAWSRARQEAQGDPIEAAILAHELEQEAQGDQNVFNWTDEESEQYMRDQQAWTDYVLTEEAKMLADQEEQEAARIAEEAWHTAHPYVCSGCVGGWCPGCSPM